jgi:phosphatidate phosphatase APP1
MSGLKKKLTRFAAGIEETFDDLALHLRRRLGSDNPLQIVTYRSYGTLHSLHVKGRVLEEKIIRKSADNDQVWRNLISMYQRFESNEIPNAYLKITVEDSEYFVTTDSEGYFILNVTRSKPLLWKDMWHEAVVELVNAPVSFIPPIKSSAEVLVPPSDAAYGIISDIDDTVVKTTATSLIAMARNTFFKNAHTRLPFAGVSEFYKALQSGSDGKRNNPFFYVSSSPWNLYDLLIDFLDLNDIPPGPLLLRDFGLDLDKESSGHMGHKFKEISDILLTYPHLNFVLIGDSGQEDPKIYQEVVKKFPGRILAIYIRDVQLADREKIAVTISKELAAGKVEMVIVDNTLEAAEHAAKTGLIYREAIHQIMKDKKKDKGEVPGKERM